MPKKTSGIRISLDLLRPQSQPQQIVVKLFSWLLSSGRFLIIAVEVLVLAAFLARFKLDSDLSSTREAIEEQIPFIESLSSDETLIRQTKFQLATIKDVKQTSPDFSKILIKLAKQTPAGVTIKTLNMQKTADKVELKLAGSALDSNQMASFAAGLKSDESFQDLSLGNISFETGVINFTLATSVPVNSNQERKL